MKDLTITGCSACGGSHTVRVNVPGSFSCPTNGIEVFVENDPPERADFYMDKPRAGRAERERKEGSR